MFETRSSSLRMSGHPNGCDYKSIKWPKLLEMKDYKMLLTITGHLPQGYFSDYENYAARDKKILGEQLRTRE